MALRRHFLLASLASAVPLTGQPKAPRITTRQASILASKQVIEQECRLAANGDWNKWHESSKSYRKALLKVYDDAGTN